MQRFCGGRAAWSRLLAGLLVFSGTPTARADTVLTFKYTPAPRAQIAIWIEDSTGRFLATAALTEAVGFRGIGNRPGASQMNSGYRWPYGRREGVLPVWAHRRAAAPGARLFPRVIFQKRVEGLASQTSVDQSPDRYFCLQFDPSKSSRDKLDAVSCASAFNSDKGRYMTSPDLADGYAEPWQDAAPAGELPVGHEQPLPMGSLYPPRMDVERCSASGSCFDHEDVMKFASDARDVMPEIDAVTIATPAGESPQSLLFTVPKAWPDGEYVAYIEVNVEGDYNDRWNASTYPTPQAPQDDWDYYAKSYGYAYRGQPSLVWKVAFKTDPAPDVEAATDEPIGRSSWAMWDAQYGQLETISVDPNDLHAISAATNNSGVNRLHADASGHRFSVQVKKVAGTVPPEPPDAGIQTPPAADAAAAPLPSDAGADSMQLDAAPTMDAADAAADATPRNADAAPLTDAEPEIEPVGPVDGLTLRRHPNPLRAHAWVVMRLRAAHAAAPLHAYEVRIATEPITDEASFIREGRQAKNATDDPEGATLLSLPTDIQAGEWIETTIGDLSANTHYFVGVRATDELNRHGPISVAQVDTTPRRFATVSPCFVASAAYGSPLAQQVGVLRRLRDRQLLPSAVGRTLVHNYYVFGAPIARWLDTRPHARAAARALLTPLLALARLWE